MMKKKLMIILVLVVGMFLTTSNVFAATVYEAEDGNLGGDARTEDHEDASGGYFVLGLDTTDDYVEIDVSVPEAGTYPIEIGYSNGADEGKLTLKVNGEEVAGGVTFPSTVDENGDPQWGIFDTITVDVDLEEGTNTLHFTWLENWVQLDYLKVFDEGEEASDAGEDTANDENAEEVENPQTSDKGMASYIMLGSLSLIGLGAIFFNRKRTFN